MGSLACRAGENKEIIEDTTYGLSALKDILDAIEGSGFATATDSLKVLRDILDLIRTELTFELQEDATLAQAPPVQNTWYTILDTTLNVRIYGVDIKVEDDNETLQVRITVDGQTKTGSKACTADTSYDVRFPYTGGVLIIDSTIRMDYSTFMIEGRSVKIEIRKTTATGTGTLRGRAQYGKR